MAAKDERALMGVVWACSSTVSQVEGGDLRMERYPALNIVIGLSNVIAYGLAALLVIAGVIGAVQKSIIALVGAVILAFLVWLGVKAYSELVQVLVNIEKNTRLYQDILPMARGQGEAPNSGDEPQCQ